jgi:hypothetical protein
MNRHILTAVEAADELALLRYTVGLPRPRDIGLVVLSTTALGDESRFERCPNPSVVRSAADRSPGGTLLITWLPAPARWRA